MTLEERFFSKVVQTSPDQCWEWVGVSDNRDRPVFWLKGRNHPAPRVAWLIAHGTWPEGNCVCHHCDNPRCTNPGHLFLGSHADNMRDKMQKGRWSNGAERGRHWMRLHPERIRRGAQCHNTVLTPEIVQFIRALSAPGEASNRDIACQVEAQFGVKISRHTVRDIAAHRTWKWL